MSDGEDSSAEIHNVETTSTSQGKFVSAGRPTNTHIRSNFTEITCSNGAIKQKCNICQSLVSKNVTLMKKHFKKCEQNPKNKDTQVTSGIPGTEVPRLNPVTSMKQMKMPVVRTNNVVKEQIDLAAARFWYASGLAFNNANLQVWKQLCETLRPGYKAVTYNRLRDDLLDKVYNELKEEMCKEIVNSEVTLIQDGWSNIYREPTINHCLIRNGKPYFVNSVQCKGEVKNASYVFEKLEEAMELLEKDFRVKVTGVVTDNCNTMLALRNLCKEKYGQLLVYGCSAHMISVAMKSVVNPTIIAKIKQVNSYFRNNDLPRELLKQKKGIRPKMPNDVKWTSYKEFLNSFLKNWPLYVNIFVEGERNNMALDRDVQQILNHQGLFRTAQDLDIQVDKLTKAIDACQRDDCNIAEALHIWFGLMKDESLQAHKNILYEKMKKCVTDDFYIAYIFHPKHKGELLSGLEKIRTMEYLDSNYPEYTIIATKLLVEDPDMFPKFLFKASFLNSAKPDQWWEEVSRYNTVNPGLIKLLVKMFRSPASTASIERFFSTFPIIQTKLRNSLAHEKVVKLSYCYRTLRGRENATNTSSHENVESEDEVSDEEVRIASD